MLEARNSTQLISLCFEYFPAMRHDTFVASCLSNGSILWSSGRANCGVGGTAVVRDPPNNGESVIKDWSWLNTSLQTYYHNSGKRWNITSPDAEREPAAIVTFNACLLAATGMDVTRNGFAEVILSGPRVYDMDV